MTGSTFSPPGVPTKTKTGILSETLSIAPSALYS